MTRAKPPCKADGIECERRYIGCHAECEKWHEYLAAHQAEKEMILRKKRTENDANAFMIEQGDRNRRANQAKYEAGKRRR